MMDILTPYIKLNPYTSNNYTTSNNYLRFYTSKDDTTYDGTGDEDIINEPITLMFDSITDLPQPPKPALSASLKESSPNNATMAPPKAHNKRAPLITSQSVNNTQQQHYLTIEELRTARNSCWLCGCNWQQDHVSLDCPECDGYALSRPCPKCDGECKQIWRRNLNNTHDRHKASWIGQCGKQQKQQKPQELNSNKNTEQTTNSNATAKSGDLKEIYIMALVR